MSSGHRSLQPPGADRRVILLVATRTIDDYNTFVQKKLAQVPGVQSIDSRIVLEETKNTTELPLAEISG